METDRVGCEGAAERAPCADGICYATVDGGGVCLDGGCANFLLDTGEQCDDGNNTSLDGCSADCTSNETCGNGEIDTTRNEDCDDQNVFAHDGCSSACSLETPRWEATSWNIAPGAGWAMAYDVARRRIVLFGGARFVDPNDYGVDGLYGATFESDGVAWLRRDPRLSPSARYAHAMAYDASRNRIVVFGGREETELGDTWEWNGERWSRFEGVTPPPRAFHTMTYDAVRKRIVMFGGERGGTDLDDTWEFDGTTWSEVVTTVHPAPRSRHVMAFDPVRGVVVVAGGQLTDDTWEYDGTWRATPAQLPRKRSAAAFDTATQRVVAFGGRTRADVVTNDLLAYDGQAWTPVAAASPPAMREAHALVSDPFGPGVVLSYGVFFNVPSLQVDNRADTARWNGTAWQVATPIAVPQPRYRTGLAVDPVHRRAIMFGGNSASGSFGDTWLLENETWRQLPMQGTQPAPRQDHVLVYDTLRDRAVMFGGETGGIPVAAETWLWNGTWSKASPAVSPGPRHGARGVFDRARGRVVMHGGLGAAAGETWEWDGSTWTLATTSGPVVLQHALAYDPIRRRTVMFTHSGETWEWDGTAWNRRMPLASPPPTLNAALGWDPATRTLVLHGGYSQSTSATRNSVWAWNGEIWRQIDTDSAPARASHEVFAHPTGYGIAVLAGSTQTPQPMELWHLSFSGAGPPESCFAASDVDGDGAAGCDDPDCWYTCTPLCEPGVTCDPTAPRCGDGTCNTSLETCSLCPADCGACAPVCGNYSCDVGETVAACPGDC